MAFVAGNRDFLVGEDLLRDAGMHGWADPTLLQAFGSSVLLTHGDALCLSDTRYQAFRRQVRGAAWQSAFLSQPLAERQAQARQMRDASEQGREHHQMSWGDVDVPCALAWLDAAGSRRLIHGHTHHPSHDHLDSTHERWVLSDWDFEATRPRADVLRWTATGIERRQPAG
jgi:UDP-2,3-diacylglucosamine hydrolase